MKSIAQRQSEGIKPIVVRSGDADRRMLKRLTAEAKDKACGECLSDIWVAWHEDAWQLRCLDGFTPKIIKRKNQLSIRGGQSMLERRPDLPAVYEPGQALTVMPEQRPMTIEEFKSRQELVKYVVGEMEDKIHYGQILDTRDKSLWEPGAEYLRAAFNIQWDYELIEEREDFEAHEYYYRFRVFQLLGPSVRGPGWETSAWSKEKKFAGMEVEMLSHNVRDRALKRGFVAMIRNVTGTTGYFKQALDVDSDEAGDNNENRHPWLVTCPVDKIKWFKSGNMREPAHKLPSGEWCNQSRVLKPMIDEQLREIVADSWEKKDVDSFLKTNFGGTWSTLSPKIQLDAIEQLKTTPPPGSQDPNTSATMGEVPDTHGIFTDSPTTPESEGPPPQNQGAMTGMGEPGQEEH